MSTWPHVVFYTKPGCHLCDEARREIRDSGCAGRFTYEEIDILSDPELERRYGLDVPVILIEDKHAFKHRLTAPEFRRAIELASRKQEPVREGER
jgi:glutaredoxin